MMKLRGLLLLLTLSLPSVQAQQSTAATRQELTALQQEIQQTERQRRDQRQRLKKAENQLKQSDQALSLAVQAVSQQQGIVQKLSAELQVLQQQMTTLEQERQRQQQLLAAQVKAAYQVGGHDYTQLLLNQQDALKLERTLTYYQYFNNARMQQLAALKATVAELAAVQRQSDQAKAEQEQQLIQLQQQQQQLAQARQQQTQSVQELKAALSSHQQQLDYLKSNEKSLQNTLAKLKAQAASRRPPRLGKTGQLPWPVQGQISQRFGTKQNSGMTASGLIIETKAGTEVRAVAAGQVIYADWLKGYGWVTVIDHGSGLMSLYGHNQTLLKTPGQIVETGDAVALVGQSGGQDRPGLYFEIRQKGNAVDPQRWLTAR